MKKKSLLPQTKVKNPEPSKKDENWVIWAAWADRITSVSYSHLTLPTTPYV